MKKSKLMLILVPVFILVGAVGVILMLRSPFDAQGKKIVKYIDYLNDEKYDAAAKLVNYSGTLDTSILYGIVSASGYYSAEGPAPEIEVLSLSKNTEMEESLGNGVAYLAEATNTSYGYYDAALSIKYEDEEGEEQEKIVVTQLVVGEVNGTTYIFGY